MNSLCLRVWLFSKNQPTEKTIQSHWVEIIREERFEIIRELSTLSPGQRKILLAIAEGENKALTSKAFLAKINMSGSSISEATQALEEKDYIEKNENQEYIFIDPIIKATLLYYYSDTQ